MGDMNPIIHCSKCGSDKPREAFHPSRIRGSVKSTWCRECLKVYTSGYFSTEKGKQVKRRSLHKRKATDPDGFKARARASNLKFWHGMSVEEFDRMNREQDGKCHLCGGTQPGKPKPLFVDHDHQTGRIRRLLCHGCNSALGTFKDDPELLRRAADYIESFRPAPTE